MIRSALLSRSFGAMGTQIQVTGCGVTEADFDQALANAIASAEEWEAKFSRFRPHSELSRLNRSRGTAMPVSRDMLFLLETVTDGVRETRGRFNPAVLPALDHLGYDRTFTDIADTSANPLLPGSRRTPVAWIDEIEIDCRSGTVTLPSDVQLDLGGIAKGAFVDRLASRLSTWPGGCIDAGGDLTVWGKPPIGASWRIGVEHPDVPGEDVTTVVVSGGSRTGLATSAPNRRAWSRGGQRFNHLIDPDTGDSIAMTSPQITVIARDVVTAEILTKSLLIRYDRSPAAPLAPPVGTLAVVAFQDGTYETLTPASLSGSPFFESGTRQTA